MVYCDHQFYRSHLELYDISCVGVGGWVCVCVKREYHGWSPMLMLLCGFNSLALPCLLHLLWFQQSSLCIFCSVLLILPIAACLSGMQTTDASVCVCAHAHAFDSLSLSLINCLLLIYSCKLDSLPFVINIVNVCLNLYWCKSVLRLYLYCENHNT